MAEIFTPWRMNQLEIPNRTVRSATWEGMAKDDGSPTEDTVNFIAEPAEGGVGLVITGFAYVSPEGKALPRQTGAHIDAMVGPLTRITDAVHKVGGLVALQIVHCGGMTKSDWCGGTAYGPSAMQNHRFGEQVQELSRKHIKRIVIDFAAAAARAQGAGFDAVQLHAAHGYLISQFLSPYFNQRQDEYGGSLENRARFLLQVYQAVRQAVGPMYPVFAKINCQDFVENGFSLEESIEVCARLSEMGLDAVEISGGTSASPPKFSPDRPVKTPEAEGYFLDEAKAVKAAVKCPVISVGGYRTRSKIEEALNSVDAVSLSRPLIRQPGLVNAWKAGGNDKPTCISCSMCIPQGIKDMVCCVQDLKEKDQA